MPSSNSRIHIFPKCAWNFSRVDNILDHKISFTTFKKAEIINSNFSNDNVIKLETSNKRKTEKLKIFGNNTILNNQRVKKKARMESRKYLKTNENKNTTHKKLTGSSESSAQREI